MACMENGECDWTLMQIRNSFIPYAHQCDKSMLLLSNAGSLDASVICRPLIRLNHLDLQFEPLNLSILCSGWCAIMGGN